MPHELREILEVVPEGVALLRCLPDGDAALRADDPLVRALVRDGARLHRELLRTHDVECGHGEHVRRGEQCASAVILRVRHDLAEQREIDRVARDARPHRLLRLLAGKDRDAVRYLARPERSHEAPVPLGVADAADLRHRFRCEDLREPKSKTEDTEEVREALASRPTILVGDALISRRRRDARPCLITERRTDRGRAAVGVRGVRSRFH